jgi:hypothetical protein
MFRRQLGTSSHATSIHVPGAEASRPDQSGNRNRVCCPKIAVLERAGIHAKLATRRSRRLESLPFPTQPGVSKSHNQSENRQTLKSDRRAAPIRVGLILRGGPIRRRILNFGRVVINFLHKNPFRGQVFYSRILSDVDFKKRPWSKMSGEI